MPIFMDLHIVPGVTPKEVAEAHSHDVKIQHEFCCRTMTYWIDEDKGSVFCLIEAPDRESVKEMHRKAHGLIPNEIIEVDSKVVESFLGRICDPETFQQAPGTDLKVFSDPAFRIILVAKVSDARLLQLALGQKKTKELLLLYNTIVHELVSNFDGREVDRKEDEFILSFTSVTQAVECALAIQKRLHVAADLIGLRMGLHAGVPVSQSNELFGDTINLASYLCSIARDNQILLSATVRSLFKEKETHALAEQSNIRRLTAAEENFLETLIHTLGKHWRDPQFGVPDFCEIMSISKPQLYRKSMAATGMSPNTLLREYRLLQSINILRSEGQNISEITFNTGFSSPSYFTKCFQKRFGLQPRVYLKAQARG